MSQAKNVGTRPPPHQEIAPKWPQEGPSCRIHDHGRLGKERHMVLLGVAGRPSAAREWLGVRMAIARPGALGYGHSWGDPCSSWP